MSQQTTLTISVTRNDTPNTDTEAFAPELTVIDGVAFCTSLQIAEHFKKEHKNVIRDIEATIAQVIETSNKLKSELTENLFQKGEYSLTNNLGFAVKKPMYLLTRRGFTLLVMGYEGVEAMRFKLAYMDAFDQMEQTLKPVAKEQAAPRYITNHQYQQLRNKIGDLAARTLNSNSAESYLWNKLRFELNLENSTKLPADQFEQAEALVNAMQKTYFAKGGVHEFLRELSTHLLREHVCEGVPLTNDLRNHWRKQTGLVLPQPLNWKALALKQDQLEHAA